MGMGVSTGTGTGTGTAGWPLATIRGMSVAIPHHTIPSDPASIAFDRAVVGVDTEHF
jgi:hypothetical protein